MNKIGWGIVTGASSGIGKELARIHASKGGDVILVARRGDELVKLSEELRENYNVETRVIVVDLNRPHAAQEIADQITNQGLEIDFLFNNAGVGGYGLFHERSISSELDMIQLNISALVELTHLILPQMIKRRKGRILNTSSTAGFVPGPLMTNYYATKAFVNSFSLGLSEEVKRYNITVTALCPGPVATGFEEAAGMKGNSFFDHAATAKETALKGYNAMLKGRRVKISSPLLSFMLKWIVPFTPNSIVLKTIQKFQMVK